MVGAFRAAAYGGYLPEMLDRLIAYYEQWRTVRRWSLWTQGRLWHAVLLLPLIGVFGLGLVWGFRAFTGGGESDALRAIASGVGQAYLRYGLPATLLLTALMLLGYMLSGLERLSAPAPERAGAVRSQRLDSRPVAGAVPVSSGALDAGGGCASDGAYAGGGRCAQPRAGGDIARGGTGARKARRISTTRWSGRGCSPSRR